MKKVLFVDAETDGLYGQVLSIAAVVVDDTFVEIEQFYGKQNISIDAIQEDWVKENVYPILGECPEFDSEAELLDSFWEFYRKHSDSWVVVDVPYPVENSVFYKCVMKDSSNRKFAAPFPLMDLSSMLFAKGIEPLKDRCELIGRKETMHNALTDVRVLMEIFKKYIV